MEFNLEVPHDHFFIRSISDRGIRINDDYFTDPFIVSGQRIVPQWNVESVGDINETSLQAIFDLQPEVILLGTGAKQVFLPTSTQVHFYRHQVGFEVMATDAACRTFNVLASEGRQVVAALLPITTIG